MIDNTLRELKKKYRITVLSEDKDITNIKIDGFKDDYNNDLFTTIQDLIYFNDYNYRIIKIGPFAFYNKKINGYFPMLEHLEIIEEQAFVNCSFTGDFKKLKSLLIIKPYAFLNNKFNGSFYDLPNLEFVGEYAFQGCTFLGTFGPLKNLKILKAGNFINSNFKKLNTSNINYCDEFNFVIPSYKNINVLLQESRAISNSNNFIKELNKQNKKQEEIKLFIQ